MYRYIALSALALTCASSSFSLFAGTPNIDNILSSDEINKVKKLSRTILLSRVVRKKIMDAHLELEKKQLKLYEKIILTSGRDQPTAVDEDYVEVVAFDAEDSSSKNTRERAEIQRKVDNYNRMSNRFAALAMDIDTNNSKAFAEKAGLERVKEDAKQEVEQKRKILELLREAASEYNNVDVTNHKEIERLGKMHERFRITNKSHKEEPESIAGPPPTNQIRLKYSIEEFEAIK